MNPEHLDDDWADRHAWGPGGTPWQVMEDSIDGMLTSSQFRRIVMMHGMDPEQIKVWIGEQGKHWSDAEAVLVCLGY